MAKYQAEALLFVERRLIAPGESFESDDVPGRNWKPLDDAAKAAVTAHFGDKPKGPVKFVQPATIPVEPTAPVEEPKPPESLPVIVQIPPDWDLDRPERIINLARRLGAPVRGTGTEAAKEWIKAELKQRAEAVKEK
ncbi:MAG: hypothetical protein Q7R45_07315 [Sulfuricaulis sp.]|nr:hypothetical protein [Sulfuricaulis sp.]